MFLADCGLTLVNVVLAPVAGLLLDNVKDLNPLPADLMELLTITPPITPFPFPVALLFALVTDMVDNLLPLTLNPSIPLLAVFALVVVTAMLTISSKSPDCVLGTPIAPTDAELPSSIITAAVAPAPTGNRPPLVPTDRGRRTCWCC
jgi:hypothetical protein